MLAALLSLMVIPASEGTLIICNQQDHNVYLADLKTNKVIHKIKTGFGPHEAAVSPSGKIVAIANYGTAANAEGPGNSITLIELPTGKVMKTVSTGEYLRPHGLAWKNEDEVFATSEVKGALILLDTTTEKISRIYETKQRASHMLAYAGKRIYAANIVDATVSVFETETGTKLGDIGVGKGSEGVGVSPDAKFVWTGNRSDNTVSVIDTQAMKTVETIACEGLPYRIVFAPDGSKVLVPCPVAGELAVFDANTRKPLGRISMNGGSEKFTGVATNPGPVGVAVHPNSKIAYCSVQMGYAVAIVDLKELKVIGKIEAGKSPDGLAVSKIKLRY